MGLPFASLRREGEALPSVMVRPEIVTVALCEVMSKMRTLLPPLIVMLPALGPAMVMFCEICSSLRLSVMVEAGTPPNWMVLPRLTGRLA